jgi:hypothetical protein
MDDVIERLRQFPHSAAATDDPNVRMAVVGR